MNGTKLSEQVRMDEGATAESTAKPRVMGTDLATVRSELTLGQRIAICFASAVVGAIAVVALSHILFALGISEALGVKAPVSLKSPDIYKPLFWGGLWGIPFGLLIKTVWDRLYLVGFLYYLVPMVALFLFFLPKAGAGYFGLHLGSMFPVYILLINLPFGIVTALTARAIIGKHP